MAGAYIYIGYKWYDLDLYLVTISCCVIARAINVQARSEGGFDGVRTNPPFSQERKLIIIIIMSCYATLSRIDLYMYYIIPSVDVDLAITIDRIAPA